MVSNHARLKDKLARSDLCQLRPLPTGHRQPYVQNTVLPAAAGVAATKGLGQHRDMHAHTTRMLHSKVECPNKRIPVMLLLAAFGAGSARRLLLTRTSLAQGCSQRRAASTKLPSSAATLAPAAAALFLGAGEAVPGAGDAPPAAVAVVLTGASAAQSLPLPSSCAVQLVTLRSVTFRSQQNKGSAAVHSSTGWWVEDVQSARRGGSISCWCDTWALPVSTTNP